MSTVQYKRLPLSGAAKTLTMQRSRSDPLDPSTEDGSCSSSGERSESSGERLDVAISLTANRATGRVCALAAVPVQTVQSPRDHRLGTVFYVEIDHKQPPLHSAHEFPAALSPRHHSTSSSKPANRLFRHRSRSQSVDLSAMGGAVTNLVMQVQVPRRTPSPRSQMTVSDAFSMLVGWLARRMEDRQSQVAFWTAGPPWLLVRQLCMEDLGQNVQDIPLFDNCMVRDARHCMKGWSTNSSWRSMAGPDVVWLGVEKGGWNDGMGTQGSALDTVMAMHRLMNRPLFRPTTSWSPLDCYLQAAVRQQRLKPVISVSTISDLFPLLGLDAQTNPNLRRFVDGPVEPLLKRLDRRDRHVAGDLMRAKHLPVPGNPCAEMVLDCLELHQGLKLFEIK